MDAALEQRLALVDLYLEFCGRATRNNLVRHFNVGTATASRTLKEYASRWPHNATVVPGNAGGYFRTPEFQAGYSHSAEQALQLLCHGSITSLLPVETYGPTPIHLSAPLNIETVSAVTRAMIKKGTVQIGYISGTSGRNERVIHPRHLFQGGGAWYCRAFDEMRREYRTFRFSRMAGAEEIHGDKRAPIDEEWGREVTLTIAPHDKHPNPEAHAMDLGMSDKPVVDLVSNAVVAGFVLTDLRVDSSKHGDMNPFEYPLRLLNAGNLAEVSSMGIAPGYSSL